MVWECGLESEGLGMRFGVGRSGNEVWSRKVWE